MCLQQQYHATIPYYLSCPGSVISNSIRNILGYFSSNKIINEEIEQKRNFDYIFWQHINIKQQ